MIELIKGAEPSCKGYGKVKRDNECGSLAFLTGCQEIDSIGESDNVDLCDDPALKGFGVFYIEELDNEKIEYGMHQKGCNREG